MTRIEVPSCVIAAPAEHAPSPMPLAVLKALSFVRKTRLIDMADRETALLIAAAYGFDEAVDWLSEHREAYFPSLSRLSSVN